MVLERLFTEHPQSVGETYFEHQRQAFSFGGTMVIAGFACILHGLLPAICCRTGSRAVTRLYERMVLHRSSPGRTQEPPRQLPGGLFSAGELRR
jgi:hypothetical protein